MDSSFHDIWLLATNPEIITYYLKEAAKQQVELRDQLLRLLALGFAEIALLIYSNEIYKKRLSVANQECIEEKWSNLKGKVLNQQLDVLEERLNVLTEFVQKTQLKPNQ